MDNNWKLDKIEICFKHGYDHEKDPVKQKDRYEGSIRFSNGDFESFNFKVRPDMAEKYIQLLSKDIVESANDLGNRLIESLGLKDS